MFRVLTVVDAGSGLRGQRGGYCKSPCCWRETSGLPMSSVLFSILSFKLLMKDLTFLLHFQTLNIHKTLFWSVLYEQVFWFMFEKLLKGILASAIMQNA